MSRFKTPFHVRSRRVERYANDPQWRLKAINSNRQRTGLPLLTSPDEIRGLSESARETAARKTRDARGRFV